MSVFEDLIGELKNDNLLEDTVIDLGPVDAAAGPDRAARIASASAPSAGNDPDGEDLLDLDIPQIEKPSSDREFFRKRAMEEVTSLQMVEHVLSGIEREHLKVSPKSYDDLNAKKALHKFLQLSGDVRSPEHTAAEFALRNETEAWNFTLYERDHRISVANVRRFCEESRPVLSSQALIALARFYRNSPFSEDVRSKFDYVMTKLFSREESESERKLLFGHDEMIGHINTLYGNWSSIALYTGDDDQTEIMLAVARFDEFTTEVEDSNTFDELLRAGFFERVRAYKEELAEMFYVPEVLAASMVCNLATGNRYVQLIGKERAAKSSAQIEEKYGTEHDLTVSNAAAKTLLLSDVLTYELNVGEAEPQPEARVVTKALPTMPTKPSPRVEQKASIGSRLLGINRRLVVLCVVFVLIGVGVHVWVEKYAGGGESAEVQVAKSLQIDDPEIKKYLRSPSQTGETFYAVVESDYETLTGDEKRELLGKVLTFVNSRNLKKVNLLNREGRSVGFASKDRLELVD